MNERIRKFMESQGISSSELADTIGVQRSNITHVLKGRNMPSFPFIEKLLQKYPALSAKWLLLGEGEMLEEKIKNKFPKTLFDMDVPTLTEEVKPIEKTDKEPENIPQIAAPKAPIAIPHVVSTSKNIDKIIIFYEDKTFEAYHPSK